jgi:hypothetical protein
VFLAKLEGRRQSFLGALPARRANEAAIRETVGRDAEGEGLTVLSPDAMDGRASSSSEGFASE